MTQNGYYKWVLEECWESRNKYEYRIIRDHFRPDWWWHGWNTNSGWNSTTNHTMCSTPNEVGMYPKSTNRNHCTKPSRFNSIAICSLLYWITNQSNGCYHCQRYVDKIVNVWVHCPVFSHEWIAWDTNFFSDGAAQILQRIEPSFIFCDADVLLLVEKITVDIGLNAKLFSVNGKVKGFDSIDSLMSFTGQEDSFVYVYSLTVSILLNLSTLETQFINKVIFSFHFISCARITDAFTHAAVIACSSGTTGLPKSICISHALLTHVYSSGLFGLPFVGMCFSSLYWFSGVLALISSAFGSTRVSTSQSFSTDLFFDFVERYKVRRQGGSIYYSSWQLSIDQK